MGVDRVRVGVAGDGTIQRALQYHVTNILSISGLPQTIMLVEKNLGAHFEMVEGWFAGEPRVVVARCCPTATSGVNQTRELKAVMFGMVDSALRLESLRIVAPLFSFTQPDKIVSKQFSASLRAQRFEGGPGPKSVPRLSGDDWVVGVCMCVWYLVACYTNPRVHVLENQKGVRQHQFPKQPGRNTKSPKTRAVREYLLGLANKITQPLKIAEQNFDHKHLGAVKNYCVNSKRSFFIQLGLVEVDAAAYGLVLEAVRDTNGRRHHLLHPAP